MWAAIRDALGQPCARLLGMCRRGYVGGYSGGCAGIYLGGCLGGYLGSDLFTQVHNASHKKRTTNYLSESKHDEADESHAFCTTAATKSS